MKVKPPTVDVSDVARRGLGVLITEKTGSEVENASHEQIVEQLGEVLDAAVAEWEATGKEAIRRTELEDAQRAFEEAKARLEAVQKSSGD